jgi:hypothetical protein
LPQALDFFGVLKGVSLSSEDNEAGYRTSNHKYFKIHHLKHRLPITLTCQSHFSIRFHLKITPFTKLMYMLRGGEEHLALSERPEQKSWIAPQNCVRARSRTN